MRWIGALVVSGFLLAAEPVVAACGIERWPVRVAADADASLIVEQFLPSTIATLRGIPAPRPLPQERRIAPVETTIYSVIATMTDYRIGPDLSLHLVLVDEAGRTIVAQIPDPSCASGSRFIDDITTVRQRFLSRFPATESFTHVSAPLEVRGVGFFDFIQGQRGLTPNGLSLQPVVDIDFTPTPRPKAPPGPLSRRRAVRAPAGCVFSTLSLSASKGSVCVGEQTNISWQASDPAASVSIDGLGTFLPAAGTRAMTIAASTAYSARASNGCGAGDEVVTVVILKPAPTAELTGPGSLKKDASASLQVTIAGSSSWTLTSSLGNSIVPSSGTTSGSARYMATRTGADIVTLYTTGGCGTISRTISITVTEDQPPGGLRCCDGTRSPTCFSCANKRGCCSSHGGVCGCPTALEDGGLGEGW